LSITTNLELGNSLIAERSRAPLLNTTGECMQLERMLKEEAELDKQFLAMGDDPSTEAKPPIPNVDTFDLDNIPDEDDPTGTTPEVNQESKEGDAEKKTKQSWKQRHINYKASTDKTIYNLRTEVTYLKEQLGLKDKRTRELESKVAILESRDQDPFDITPEDIALIGPEAVDIVKKATKKATESAINPLAKELEEIRARELAKIKQELADKEAADHRRFLFDLGKIVPDYEEINFLKGFEDFMLAIDSSTGESRLNAFKRAEQYKDAERVADFFLEYKASIPKSKKLMLEDKITPDGSNSTSAPQSKRAETFTMKEVDKFFNDVNKGLYRNKIKEANELEARITKAYIEGRITD